MILLMFLAQFSGVLQLLFLASFSRTIRWHTILLAFFVGIALCAPGTLLLQLGWTHLYAGITQQPYSSVVSFAAYTFDPFIEEVVKVLPLFLVCLVPRVRQQLGLADMVIICAAFGSGFGMTEDLFRFSYTARMGFVGITSGNWMFTSGLNIILVPGPVSIFASWVPQGATPISFVSPEQVGTNFHLALSALVGLAAALLMRQNGLFRQRSGRKTTALFLTAGVCFTLAVLIHMAHNTPYIATQQNPLFGAIALIFAQGIEQHFLALFPLLALVAAVWLDRLAIHRGLTGDQGVRLRIEQSQALGLWQFAAAQPGKPWANLQLWTFVLRRRAYALQRVLAPTDALLPRKRIRLVRAGMLLEEKRPVAPPAFLARFLARKKPSAMAAVPLWPRQDFSTRDTAPLSRGEIATMATTPLPGGDISMVSARRKPRQRFRLTPLFFLLLAVPTLLYFVIGSVPPFAWVQTLLASSIVFPLLQLLLLAGLIRQGIKLVATVRKLPKVLKLTDGQMILTILLGFFLMFGSLCSGIGVAIVSILSHNRPLQPAISGHVLDAFLLALLLVLLLFALLLLLLAIVPEILPVLGELLADEAGALRIGVGIERNFASEELLASHFADHGVELGLETAEDYLAAANQFFEGGEGVEVFEFTNGDVGFYNEATNEFGVLTENGVIKTYYMPEGGIEYWLTLIGRL